MSCDRRCFDKDDKYFGHEDCSTCPGRDDGSKTKGLAKMTGTNLKDCQMNDTASDSVEKVIAEMRDLESFYRVRYWDKQADEFLAFADRLTALQSTGNVSVEEAIKNRDRLLCDAVIFNQYSDPNDYGRLKLDCEVFLHDFNQRKALPTPPKESNHG